MVQGIYHITFPKSSNTFIWNLYQFSRSGG